MTDTNKHTEAANTDREIWRETEGDYYAPRIFVTETGSIGIDVGGTVFVKPVQDWHSLAAAPLLPEMAEALEGLMETYVELVDSHSSLYWDPEKVTDVINARAVLAKYKGGE